MGPVVSRGVSSSASFAGYGEGAPLEIPGHVDASGLLARLRDGSADGLSDALASVHNCARPIRLHGSSVTVDAATGEVISSVSSSSMPLGVLHVPCGNRRAHVCPACSRTYARDTFEMIRSGVTGGKTVPGEVADNPLLFVTLTAPSFGPVHGVRAGRACRPRSSDQVCPHGRPVGCHARHDETDEKVGAPICPDCYDLDTAIVWQWHAPELWRRTTIAIKRALAARLGVPEPRLKEHAALQYAKVAEYQARGLVHFHALIRLDGPAAHGIGAPAPASIDGRDLARLVADTIPTVATTADAIDGDDTARVLRWGAQIDVRTVRDGHRTDAPGEDLTPGQVAGYLAKYATKDASAVMGEGRTRPHLARMRTRCAELAERASRARDPEHDYQRMGKWVHCLGFRGHFSTKSRRYSITLGRLRRARRRFQHLTAQAKRRGEALDTADLEARLLADDEETTLVIGAWTYAGTGWRDEAETALALAAAGRAREYAQWRSESK